MSLLFVYQYKLLCRNLDDKALLRLIIIAAVIHMIDCCDGFIAIACTCILHATIDHYSFEYCINMCRIIVEVTQYTIV